MRSIDDRVNKKRSQKAQMGRINTMLDHCSSMEEILEDLRCGAM
ncbi:uncharacterized protein METZ01_LOCUS423863, partial [marine metagenome]